MGDQNLTDKICTLFKERVNTDYNFDDKYMLTTPLGYSLLH